MESTVNNILTKLRWIDPSLTNYSAYQKSVEIKELWKSIDSSIQTILTVINSRFSNDPIHASSQIITVLSASTLLSSIIHALIASQRRMNRSDENIERVIKKEMEVVLYHIQILKQEIHQAKITSESAQEAIIYHTGLLVDALVAFSLSPSVPYQIHPYKVVSPSYRRYSQPAFLTTSSSEESMASSNYSAPRERTDTVGKKIMRSINSLKSRPGFHMVLLPNKHVVEPISSDSPPKKKRLHNLIPEEEEEDSDDSTLYWDEVDEIEEKSKNGTATLRLLFGSKQSVNKKGKGIKDLFQSKESGGGGGFAKKRESIASLFTSPKVTKEESSSISSLESNINNKQFDTLKSTESTRHHLISPFSRKTDLEWTEKDVQIEERRANEWTDMDSFFLIKEENEEEDDNDLQVDEQSLNTALEKSRKRRSNGVLIGSELNFARSNEQVMISPDTSFISTDSAIQSIVLDDVTDILARTQLVGSTSSSSSISFTFDNKSDSSSSSSPPPVPPKDHTPEKTRIELSSSFEKSPKPRQKERSNRKKRSSTEVIFNDKQEQQQKNKPIIPPRRSSMPLPPPKDLPTPPLPKDAKKKILTSYARRPSRATVDESSWNVFLGINRKEEEEEVTKRATLGRSLGASPKRFKKLEPKLLRVTEGGNTVMLLEMINGRLQVVAGTTEKLFERLADETTQDLEYIDVFIMNHTNFVTSMNFLNQLISRFYLEPSPGEYEYFMKWQRSIQLKVLNVIDRWIKVQYQDFMLDEPLYARLSLFLTENAHFDFKKEIEKIKGGIHYQNKRLSEQYKQQIYTLPSSFKNDHNNPRRPSAGLFNLTPPGSPNIGSDNNDIILSFETKDIARYLTLADFYLLRSIHPYDLLNTRKKKEENEYDFIEIMTKRANMMSHWVIHEIYNAKLAKPRRSLIKKFIEIAKLCLEWSNFHTCMVITMGLLSSPVQKLQETWQSIPNKDMNTFSSLQKLLNVSLNMRYYRQKMQAAKAPCIPFLPVVLKDRTFFKEGNASYLVSHPNLVNFSKFRLIQQFVNTTKQCTSENYWFATELDHYPFLPNRVNGGSTEGRSSSSLSSLADVIETRLDAVKNCYNQCNLI